VWRHELGRSEQPSVLNEQGTLRRQSHAPGAWHPTLPPPPPANPGRLPSCPTNPPVVPSPPAARTFPDLTALVSARTVSSCDAMSASERGRNFSTHGSARPLARNGAPAPAPPPPPPPPLFPKKDDAIAGGAC
jgi:hypothetical protein